MWRHNGSLFPEQKKKSGACGWRIPRIERDQASLPEIKITKPKHKSFTIEDVADIRKQVGLPTLANPPPPPVFALTGVK